MFHAGVRNEKSAERNKRNLERSSAAGPLINSEAAWLKHQDYGAGTAHTGRHMKANVVCG